MFLGKLFRIRRLNSPAERTAEKPPETMMNMVEFLPKPSTDDELDGAVPANATLVESPDKNLLSEAYYHGIMEKPEVEKLLIKDGDYLFFMPEEDEKRVVFWAVKFYGRVRRFAIGTTKKGRFYMTKKCFDTIPEMVTHYSRTREPLHDCLPVIARRPIPHDAWVISHDHVQLREQLGKGAYGNVFKASLQVGHDFQTVAVKTYVGQITDRARRAAFLQEARTMREYKHENVIQLIGIACQKEPLMIVIEFCAGGSLLKYLRTQGAHLGIAVRYRFSKQASAGLRYLEEKKCIHRDVAARNCLLTENAAMLKICDFGLSIQKQNAENAEEHIQLPTKWLAPEVIRAQAFNSKTDVWSFGVLLYEIFSDGADPYPGMSNAEVRRKLTDGSRFRMSLPLEIPPGITKLIDRCWNEDADKRPTFKEINKELSKIAFN